MPIPSAAKGRYVKVHVKGVPLDEVSVQVMFCVPGWLVNCKDLMRMKDRAKSLQVSRYFRKEKGFQIYNLSRHEVEQSGGTFDADSTQWVDIAAAAMYVYGLTGLDSSEKLDVCRALMLPTLEVFAVQPPPDQLASVAETVPTEDAKESKIRVGSDDLVGKKRKPELRHRGEMTWAALRSNNIPFAQTHEQPLSQTDELTQDQFEYPASKGKHPHITVHLF